MTMSRVLMGLAVAVHALAFYGCGGSGASTPAQPVTPTTTSTQLQRAGDGTQQLQTWYSNSSGLYQTTGWWNSANATTVLVDYARVAATHNYDATLANTFKAAQSAHPGFINTYYDDEGWWALAWIDAYDLTGNATYLSMAESIFADVSMGWDGVCNGGIWWSKDRTYKNAIANELFLSVAAHLANRDATNRAQYLDWANREWSWFTQSGMINAQNLINDGLKIQSTGCVNNGANTWTYNQGVVLGGLAELTKLNPDPSLGQAADNIATAAITRLVDSAGVLHDTCEPSCGGDGVQFKGIFVRNLLVLYRARPQAAYKTFINTNANSIWNNDQGTNFQFGQVWSGPFTASNAGMQSSALDAIVAAASLETSP